MKIASTIINSLFIMLTALVVGAIVFAIIALLKADNLIQFIEWAKLLFGGEAPVIDEAPVAAKIWIGYPQI